MAEDRFGDIRIDSGAQGMKEGPEVPLEKGSEATDSSKPSRVVVSPVDPGPEHYRRGSRKGPSIKLPVPSKRVVAWLSLIPLAVVLYGVGSYFLVPLFIKGVLISNLSKDIERPIETGRIVFSPFNLELLVDKVTVGPQLGGITGEDLLSSENARFLFTLKRLFRGKIICSQASIDGVSLNLVRQKDSTVDLKTISDFFLTQSSSQQIRYWPVWFFMDEVTIDNGRVQIDDRVAQKVFTIEQIQFYLPSAETREQDIAAVPTLSAVVDSSPFEINAVRLQNQTGAWSTGFSFEFRSVILNKFRDVLPFPDSGFQLSDGEADMVLDFILPEIQHGSEGVVVEGETTLKNIQWHDPETQAVLKLPEGRVVYRIVPSEKLFRFINVEFHEPEIVLKEKKGVGGSEPHEYLHSVISKILLADEVMEVESFLINNGKLVMSRGGKTGKKSVWNDVTFSMNGFTTNGHRLAHSSAGTPKYTFRARDISAKPIMELYTEGELLNDATMKGDLKVTGLDMSSYSSMLPKTSLTMQKGKSDISFYYEYTGNPDQKTNNNASRNKIYSGKLKTTGYVLNRKGKKAAAGDLLSCSKFHSDTKSRVLVCEQLEISKSDLYTRRIFRDEAEKNSTGKDSWDFIVNNLRVSDSSVHIPIKGFGKNKKSSSVVVKKVKLDISGLQSKKAMNNIKIDGKVGKQGSLSVSGNYSHRTGHGAMQVNIKDVHLSFLRPYFSSWFVPTVKKGVLGASGSLHLPDKEFKGTVHISEFDAGVGGSARVSWKQMYSRDLVYKAEPVALIMKELVVQKPSIRSGLSSGEGPISNYLKLKGGEWPSFVRIGKVQVEYGSFEMPEPVIYPGYQPLIQNIKGYLSPASEGVHEFMFDGKLNGKSSVKVQGTSTTKNLLSYKLEASDFPLHLFDSVLRKNAGFSGQRSSASWKQSMVVEDTISKLNTTLLVKDVIPDLSSPTASILSLLIDENLSFELEAGGEYSVGKPHPFLLEQFLNKLRHLKVKGAISPHLVLKSTIPSLDLAQSVSFETGTSLVDGSVSLSGYQELFRIRPYVILSLKGQYDPVGDHDILQEKLQKEADQKREIENKRRALEKVKILQREKKRLKDMKAGSKGEVVEEVIPSDPKEDLQPLPRVIVEIDPATLQKLARDRAENLRDHLVSQLKLDPDRVKLDSVTGQGASQVQIGIHSYDPQKKEQKSDDS